MNSTQTLNLARKWRSSHFDQIVGQDLSVRMLKNSLYLGHIFPVYLFSGQRGCGKTSTARIFAAALNCEQLSHFRKHPKDTVIPCLTCSSCLAMHKGMHPDFIEIDAASHTGVDNVRSIIDASTLMPLMGEKKIYLIDEAHMLSKAAFNAFLKILEEPPLSVVFILATTDVEKIIETVRSRCFQLFFRPIKNDQLITHLQTVCLAESINHDRAGLELIVKESQGSARDALNLLEQVRFAYSAVTILSVSQVLGHVDDRALLKLLQATLFDDTRGVMNALSEISYESSSLDFIWKRLIELARSILWCKYGVTKQSITAYEAEINALAKRCSYKDLQSFIMTMHKEYATFVKTAAQHAFFEMICLSLCRRTHRDDSGGFDDSGAAQSQSVLMPMDEVQNSDESEDGDEEEDDDQDAAHVGLWSRFVADIAPSITNPLLLSVLQRGVLVDAIAESHEVIVNFPKDMQFFSEVVQHHTAEINAFLHTKYGRPMQFKALFVESKVSIDAPVVSSVRVRSGQPAALSQESRVRVEPSNYPQKKAFYQAPKKEVVSSYDETSIDVSDKNSWKKTHMILEFFPGHITEIRECTNEQQS
jgi:DNA polymerase-3 subunit gamma/tau